MEIRLVKNAINVVINYFHYQDGAGSSTEAIKKLVESIYY